MKTPNDILQEYWGFSELRPAQAEIITHLSNRKNVIALLPTGGGKSICFQIPALINEGICIVISPLIALMQDQINALKHKGIKAMMLSGKIPYREIDTMLDNCIYGNYKFLYLSPERLQQDLVRQRIQQMPVNLIAIDEAHCISEWGHDFRPAYRTIKILRDLHPKIPVIALTATATNRVIDDIKENLEIPQAVVGKYSFERKNIALLTQATEDKNDKLIRFLQKNPGVSIIYVRNRKTTIELKTFLAQEGIRAEAYHGGLSTEEKEKLLKNWLAEDFSVMVATTAFGMGIDKENVRNIIHYHLPDSMESYFQEAGRAGRDGQNAKALLLYGTSDIERLKNQFLHVLPTPKDVKIIYKKLISYFSVAYGEGQQETFNFNFFEFCKTYSLNTSRVYHTLQLLDNMGVLLLSKEYSQRTELRFIISNRHLYHFLAENHYYENPIKTLLRMQGGFFDHKSPVNLYLLSQRTGIAQEKLITIFKELHDKKVIEFLRADQDTSITFLVPREDSVTLNPLIPYIKQQYNNKATKIEAVIQYVQNNQVCKNKQLLTYFGEKVQANCGKCSVCLAKKQKSIQPKTIAEAIVDLLRQKSYSAKALVAALDFPETHILQVLRLMVDKKIISVSPNNNYTLTP